ncbi:hypothetical protein BDB01DRAFT_809458 [Pilobolus umbonatus]|nr:hypothetical protein BDB01DRAFT_809458 [Pilobolus umbonatus]
MEKLPNEVLQVVIKDFGVQEYKSCLKVNKKWYSVFIKLLYPEVKIRHPRQLMLHLNSPRCREYGPYIRVLEINPFDTYWCSVYDDMCFNSIKAIDKLSNLNELIVTHYSQLIKKPRHPKVNKGLDCTTFYQILIRCSTLVSLEYQCRALNIHLCSQLGDQTFPHIKKLKLLVDNVYPEDTIYIKTVFTGLTELTIHLGSIQYLNGQLFDVFMRMESLVTLQFKSPVPFMPDHFYLISRIAKTVTFIPDMKVTSKALMKQTASPNQMVIKNFPALKSREVTQFFKYERRIRLRPSDFRNISQHDMLEIECRRIRDSNSYPESITQRHLLGGIFDVGTFRKPKSLVLTNYHITDSTLSKIVTIFPNLQSLKLSDGCLENDHSSENMVYIKIPDSNLETIEISLLKQKVVVTEKKHGTLICTWFYNHGSKKTDMLEG